MPGHFMQSKNKSASLRSDIETPHNLWAEFRVTQNYAGLIVTQKLSLDVNSSLKKKAKACIEFYGGGKILNLSQ